MEVSQAKTLGKWLHSVAIQFTSEETEAQKLAQRYAISSLYISHTYKESFF